MSIVLPPDWAMSYDAQAERMCFTHRATRITQYHFPQPGDEMNPRTQSKSQPQMKTPTDPLAASMSSMSISPQEQQNQNAGAVYQQPAQQQQYPRRTSYARKPVPQSSPPPQQQNNSVPTPQIASSQTHQPQRGEHYQQLPQPGYPPQQMYQQTQSAASPYQQTAQAPTPVTSYTQTRSNAPGTGAIQTQKLPQFQTPSHQSPSPAPGPMPQNSPGRAPGAPQGYSELPANNQQSMGSVNPSFSGQRPSIVQQQPSDSRRTSSSTNPGLTAYHQSIPNQSTNTVTSPPNMTQPYNNLPPPPHPSPASSAPPGQVLQTYPQVASSANNNIKSRPPPSSPYTTQPYPSPPPSSSLSNMPALSNQQVRQQQSPPANAAPVNYMNQPMQASAPRVLHSLPQAQQIQMPSPVPSAQSSHTYVTAPSQQNWNGLAIQLPPAPQQSTVVPGGSDRTTTTTSYNPQLMSAPPGSFNPAVSPQTQYPAQSYFPPPPTSTSPVTPANPSAQYMPGLAHTVSAPAVPQQPTKNKAISSVKGFFHGHPGRKVAAGTVLLGALGLECGPGVFQDVAIAGRAYNTYQSVQAQKNAQQCTQSTSTTASHQPGRKVSGSGGGVLSDLTEASNLIPNNVKVPAASNYSSSPNLFSQQQCLPQQQYQPPASNQYQKSNEPTYIDQFQYQNQTQQYPTNPSQYQNQIPQPYNDPTQYQNYDQNQQSFNQPQYPPAQQLQQQQYTPAQQSSSCAVDESGIDPIYMSTTLPPFNPTPTFTASSGTPPPVDINNPSDADINANNISLVDNTAEVSSLGSIDFEAADYNVDQNALDTTQQDQDEMATVDDGTNVLAEGVR